MRIPVLVPAIALIIIPASVVCAQTSRPTSKPAKKKQVLPALGAPAGIYGGGVQLGQALSLRKAAKDLAKLHGKPIRIDGLISDVCRKKGCWMVLADGKTQVRVRFKDYGFFVPRDSSGRQVIMQGILTQKTITEELARHYAEEGGNPEAAKKIKGPQKILAFTATGVEILGQTTLPPQASPAPGSEVAKRLLESIEYRGKKVRGPSERGTRWANLQNALELLRTIPGARSQEFSLCTTLSPPLTRNQNAFVFSDAKGKAFEHGYAVRADGLVIRF